MEKTKRVSRRVFCKFLIGLMFASRLFAKQNPLSQVANGRKQFIQKEANHILVLYYSLTRNTEIMAKALASRYQADLIENTATISQVGPLPASMPGPKKEILQSIRNLSIWAAINLFF